MANMKNFEEYVNEELFNINNDILSSEEKKWLKDKLWTVDNEYGFEPRDKAMMRNIFSKLNIK